MNSERRKNGSQKFIRSIIAIAVFAPSLTGCFATSSKQVEISLKETLPTVNKAQSGWSYLEQGAYAAAVPAFQLALLKAPEQESLHFGMAEAYRYTGAIERAETHYAKALKSDEFKVGALTGIGYIMLAGQNNSGAFDMFTQAVEEDDSAWKAWLGLASLSDQARNWKKSDELYKKALKSTDDRALVLSLIHI